MTDENTYTDPFTPTATEEEKQTMRDNLQEANNILATLDSVREFDPDRAAKAVPYARRFNVPVEFVMDNGKDFENLGDFYRPQIARLAQDNPYFATWIKDPNNAMLVHDEIGSITYATDKMRSVVAGAAQFLESGLVGGPAESAKDLASFMAEGQVMMDDAGVWTDPVNRYVKLAMIGLLDMAGSTMKFASDEGLEPAIQAIAPPQERQDTFDQVSMGLGQVGGQLWALTRNPKAAMTLLWNQGVDEMSERLDDKGVTDSGTRLLASSGAGAVNLATELPVLNFLKRAVPGLDRFVEKMPKALQNKYFNTTIDITSAAGAEAGQEVLQSFLYDSIAYATFDPDVEFFDGALQEAIVAGNVGGIARGILLTIAGGKKARIVQQEVGETNAKAQDISEKVEAARRLKLSERDPESFKEMLTAANIDGQQVVLDSSVVGALYQSGTDMDKFFEIAPDAKEQFENAELTGADITLNLEDYVSLVAGEKEAALDFMQDFIKTQEGGMTAKDARELSELDMANEQVQEILQDMRAEQERINKEVERKSFAGQIRDQIRGALVDRRLMGEKSMTADMADTMAGVYEAMVRTYSRLTDGKSDDILRKIFTEQFEIRGPNEQIQRKSPYDSTDLTIQRLKDRTEANQKAFERKERAEIRRQQREDERRQEAARTGQVYKPRKRRDPKNRDMPITKMVARTGIDPQGQLAQQLAAVDITPQTEPWLFKKGGYKSMDTIPLDSVVDILGAEAGLATNTNDDNPYYADPEALLEAIVDELNSDGNAAQDSLDQMIEEIFNVAGVDITMDTSPEDIRAAIQAVNDYYSDADVSLNGATGGLFQGEEKDYRFSDDPRAGITYQKEIKTIIDDDGQEVVVHFEASKSMRENLQDIPDDYFSELEFPMYDAAEEYVSKIKSSLNTELNKYGYEIYNEDSSRQSQSVYWYIDNIGKEGENDNQIKVRFSDHSDLHGGSDVRVFWGDTPQSILEDISKELGFETKSEATGGLFQGPKGFITRIGKDGQSLPLDAEVGTVLIKMLEGADASTFMHESAHFFLDVVMRQVAKSDIATDRIKNDWQKTLDYLGVKTEEGQSPFDAKFTVKQQEKFAESFEAYLYQGNAPSAELRGIFQKLKFWMLDIYRNLKGKLKLDQEISGVFDRLLATDAEIEEVAQEPIFSIGEQTMEMLNAQQREALQRAMERDYEEAKRKLFLKAEKERRRENTKQYREEYAKINAEVTEDLKGYRSHRLVQFLTTGQDFQGNDISLDGTFKINERALAKALSVNKVDPLPRGIRGGTSGLDPDVAADLFGYNSVEDMALDLMNYTPLKLEAARKTEERIYERYGNMMDPNIIKREALEMAMESVTSVDALILETLSEKTGAQYPKDGDFKAAAQLAISDMTMDVARKPHKYYQAALKAEREYGKALGAKDYIAAADAKRRVLLNKHMFTASKEVRDNSNRAITKFQQFNKWQKRGKNTKRPSIDQDYLVRIWNVLDKYNLGPKMSAKKRDRILRKEQHISMKELQAWMDGETEKSGAAFLLPPEIAEADSKIHYTELTVSEFKALEDLIANLEHQGRLKTKLILDGQARDLRKTVMALEDTAVKNVSRYDDDSVADTLNKQGGYINALSKSQIPGAKTLAKGAANIKHGTRFVSRTLDTVSTKVTQVMSKLDGGDDFGIWKQLVYEPMQSADIKRNIRSRAEYDNMNAIFESWSNKDGSNDLMESVGVTDGEGKVITRENLISIALHYTADPDNAKKLIDGYKERKGYSKEFIENALGNMRKKDWELVMDIRDYLDSFWAETSEVEKRRFGWKPEKREPGPDTEWVTAEGERITVRGGYMRIKYDHKKGANAHQQMVDDYFNNLKTGKSSRTMMKRGAQIERVEGVKQPIRLDLNVVNEHVAEQIGLITMAENLDGVNRILKNKVISQTLIDRIGVENKEMLDLWFEDVVAGGLLASDGMNRMHRILRNNYTIGRLGLRPFTALLQVSGLSHTMARLGARKTLSAFADVMKYGNPWRAVAEIEEKSLFMKERRFTLNRDMAAVLDNYKRNGQTTMHKVAALTLWPMQKMQAIIDGTTWIAAYKEALRKGYDEEKAIRYADIQVEELQGGGLVTSLSGIERGTTGHGASRQEWIKSATMFYSYFNAKYNVLKSTHVKWQNKQISTADMLASHTFALLIEGLISATIMQQIDWDDDDDGEVTLAEIGLATMGVGKDQALSLLPGIREAAGAYQGFSAGGGAERQLEGLGRGIGTVSNAIVNLATGEEDTDGYKLTRSLTNLANVFVPLPSGAINQMVRAEEKRQRGEDVPFIEYFVYQED